ncbi:MAG TPA: GntR family transcriptional regulator [Terriglobales bacterium]|nr:GntR family transcriptional regulator [Terriglobales bacterium]
MASASALAAIIPIERQSLSDAVFRQLHAQIVTGQLPAGDPLPSERSLCEAFGVNRGAVREALRRLEQARLVSIRHGGTSRVLDYRHTAGLDLLGHLLMSAAGDFDLAVVRSVMEMRSAIAPDAARWAALRRADSMAAQIEAAADQMSAAASHLAALQATAVGFWELVIEAGDNIAYRLAYNSLRETYARCDTLLTQVLQAELTDVASYRAIAVAIRDANAGSAENRARLLVRRGEEGVKRALAEMERLSREETLG